MDYGPRIITNGLVMCVDAGDRNSYSGSGTSWTDLSGNNNTGALTNSPIFNENNGGSIVFDGINDYTLISPDNFNLTNFSIGITFKTSDIATDYLRLIHKADTTGATKGFIIANSNINGKLVFGYQPNYTTGEVLRRSTTVISTNTIYNIYMTCISSTIKIYFNGVEDVGEVSAAPDAGWQSIAGNFFSIGSRAGGTLYFFNGNIYTVSIYNRGLSATEILQNFNATRARFGL